MHIFSGNLTPVKYKFIQLWLLLGRYMKHLMHTAGKLVDVGDVYAAHCA